MSTEGFLFNDYRQESAREQWLRQPRQPALVNKGKSACPHSELQSRRIPGPVVSVIIIFLLPGLHFLSLLSFNLFTDNKTSHQLLQHLHINLKLTLQHSLWVTKKVCRPFFLVTYFSRWSNTCRHRHIAALRMWISRSMYAHWALCCGLHGLEIFGLIRRHFVAHICRFDAWQQPLSSLGQLATCFNFNADRPA